MEPLSLYVPASICTDIIVYWHLFCHQITSLGATAGFATMFILIIPLAVLGVYGLRQQIIQLWFVVENFEVSIAIAGSFRCCNMRVVSLYRQTCFQKKYI